MDGEIQWPARNDTKISSPSFILSQSLQHLFLFFGLSLTSTSTRYIDNVYTYNNFISSACEHTKDLALDKERKKKRKKKETCDT